MAGSTYWDLLAAGVIAYFGSKGTSGDTPNQYPAILPPEVKRVTDEAWRVYKDGGSPIEKDIRNMGNQYLGQMPTTAPNFSFISPEMQGQSFAGGVRAPKIDVTKLPSNTTPTTPAKPPVTTQSSAPTNVAMSPGGRFRNQDVGSDDPAWGESIANWMTRTGGSSTRANDILNEGKRPLSDFGPTAADPTTFAAIKDAFNQWRKDHPNWAELGPKAFLGFVQAGPIGAVAGVTVGVIEQAIRRIFAPPSKPGPTAPTPPSAATQKSRPAPAPQAATPFGSDAFRNLMQPPAPPAAVNRTY